MQTVFLDHQSSTPVLPEVFDAMRPFFLEAFGNPSSLHQHGLRARDALARARQQFASLIHAESADDILFTSGGTEAANLAVKGVAYANQRRGKHIVMSAIEHPSVRNSVAFLESQGFTCTRVGVNQEGFVAAEDIAAALTNETILVCVHHVNHDVGTIEPIAEIAEITNARGVPFFVDAVASAGWLPIDVQAAGIHLLSLTPHRFYGPKGVGVLYRDRRARLVAVQHGGDQERAMRPGTENVPAIVGGGLAAEIAASELAARLTHTARLQQRLWERLQATVPYLALNGPLPGPRRISTNLNVSAEFTEGEAQLLALDMAGIAVASGTSCVSRAVKVSPVLQAMGLSPALALASVIFSLGKDNTPEQIDLAVTAFAKVIQKLRAMSPLWEDFQNGLLPSVIAPAADSAGTARSTSGIAAKTSN